MDHKAWITGRASLGVGCHVPFCCVLHRINIWKGPLQLFLKIREGGVQCYGNLALGKRKTTFFWGESGDTLLLRRRDGRAVECGGLENR
jgi:hypothetical protein